MKCLETDSFNWLWEVIFRTWWESPRFIASLICTTDTFQDFLRQEWKSLILFPSNTDRANLSSRILKYSAKSKRTESILQESVKLDAWYNMLSLSLSHFLPFCIVSLSLSEHLQADWAINYLYWLPCRFRSYSSIVPITANQSRTYRLRLRQTSRRNQPIYRGTMGQHDSIVSCRLCINRPLSFFLRPDRHLYPVLRTATLLPLRSFNHNSIRGLNQTFSAISL